ncbi:MAG TPA: signal peptidase I, partial [Acidimicrobiales bacterium]
MIHEGPGAPDAGESPSDPGDDEPPGADDLGVSRAGSDSGAVTGSGARRGRRWIVEWLLVLVVAVGLALGIRAYVAQTYFIPSASMQPTLLIGDRILVDKLSYRLHGVGRGDIVVFATPPKEPAEPGINDLVKRVIGLPGDVISSKGGRVYIDGRPLHEPYLVPGTVTTDITTQKVPPNEYFVMGDNRSDSQDSRFFGPISRSLIVGRV